MRAAFVLLALIAVAAIAFAGQPRGQYLYENLSPPCYACHNAQERDLSRSRIPPAEVAEAIRNGRSKEMPAYKLKDDDMAALVKYVVDLRR